MSLESNSRHIGALRIHFPLATRTWHSIASARPHLRILL